MDEKSAQDIEQRIERILNEMGVKEPPLNLESVLNFLDVHRDYYNLSDPGLLSEIFHKLKIGARKVQEIVGEINLRGLWLPDEKKFLSTKLCQILRKDG